MKKLHKLAAAVAVAAGIALSPQANAVIRLVPNGMGDALLFPAFNGYIENYFTVSNSANEWVQGHIRFRGAAWSAELRDFDVILSPGDVFVFRLADLDGDGLWEIDQSLDTRNFQYTGMVHNDQCTGVGGAPVPLCLDASNLLEPTVNEQSGITQALINHQRNVGYVEFIGEATLNNMTHDIMNALTSGNPGVWAPYVTENGNRRGTSAWKWSDAANARFTVCANPNTIHPCNQGLLDVGNWLSGTAFVTIPGQTHGLAYNAAAFANFRTANAFHRIDNYVGTGVYVPTPAATNSARVNASAGGLGQSCSINNTTACDGATPGGIGDLNPIGGVLLAENGADGTGAATGTFPTAVILHHESASSSPVSGGVDGPSPAGDYVYGCPDGSANPATENYDDELVISFNNTWGPTLADGDDTDNGDPVDTLENPNTADFFGVLNTATSSPNDLWDSNRRNYNTVAPRPTNRRPINSPEDNSIAEVEWAIAAAGQVYESYYFHNMGFDASRNGGKATLQSHFFGFFPTKYFYGEDLGRALGGSGVATCQQYIDRVVGQLVRMAKPVAVQVWDINENNCTTTGSDISPARPNPVSKVLGQELTFWNVDWLKAGFNNPACAGFRSGRTVMALQEWPAGPNRYPGLIYTFEIGSDSALSHWRSATVRN